MSARLSGFLRLVIQLAVGLVMSYGSIGSALASDGDFDTLLTTYVVASGDGVNRVDYTRWKASATDLGRLDEYIQKLSGRAPSRMMRNDAIAFWINLYNAVTLKVVLDKYPVTSIRDIKSDNLFDPRSYSGPWKTKRIDVEGRSYSLDDIEHDALRPVFKDARIHYAVNCASLGCPNLQSRSWQAATLDADLDAAARTYVNHPRGVSILPGNILKISSIYKWFAADFGADEAGLVTHLKKYARPELAAALAKRPGISEDAYDWSLNDVPDRLNSGKKVR